MVISPPVAQGQANANELSVKSNITLGEVKTKARASQSLLAKPISTYKIGLKYLGTPYCKGGRGPNCFDCSGFTQYIYKKKGKEIARTTGGQYKQSKKIARSDAKVGDLVFFSGRRHSKSIGHVGIVVVEDGVEYLVHSTATDRKCVKEDYALSGMKAKLVEYRMFPGMED
jgi:cell wall-associated NlpC family hydrolase